MGVDQEHDFLFAQFANEHRRLVIDTRHPEMGIGKRLEERMLQLDPLRNVFQLLSHSSVLHPASDRTGFGAAWEARAKNGQRLILHTA